MIYFLSFKYECSKLLWYDVGTIILYLGEIDYTYLVIGILFSDKFQHYDLGTMNNMKKYGQPKPPEYDLKKVTSPVVLYYSKNDRVVDSGVRRILLNYCFTISI